MTTELLKKKTGRYLSGQSVPAERNQIQNWLSCTGDKKIMPDIKERLIIENSIIADIKAYIESTQLEPKQESWWKKITASF